MPPTSRLTDAQIQKIADFELGKIHRSQVRRQRLEKERVAVTFHEKVADERTGRVREKIWTETHPKLAYDTHRFRGRDGRLYYFSNRPGAEDRAHLVINTQPAPPARPGAQQRRRLLQQR